MCTFCSKTFTQSGALSLHKVIHTGERHYKCGKCEKSFKRTDDVKLHERTHQESKQFKCDKCNFEAHQRVNLLRHEKRKHNNIPPEVVICDKCNHTLSSKTGLKYHIETKHQRIQKFQCKICEFGCYRSDDLIKHVERIHLKLKIQCRICTWEGAKAALKRHNREKHTEIAINSVKFKCDICYNLYQNKCGLQKHKERAHFGVSFSCPTCEHKATTSGNLKVHIRSVHEKVKSPCNQCDYQAYDSTSLTKHNNAVHMNLKPYTCNLCPTTFSIKSYLTAHIKRVHKVK